MWHMMLMPMLRMSCLTNKGYGISRRCRSAWLLVGLSWRPKSKYNLKAIIKSKQPKQQLQPHQPCLSVRQSAFLCIRQSNRHNIFWILSTEAIVYDRAFIPSFRFCSTFSFLFFLFLQILKRFFNSHLLCFKGSYASFLLGRFLVLPGISVMNRRLSVMTDTCLEEEYFITYVMELTLRRLDLNLNPDLTIRAVLEVAAVVGVIAIIKPQDRVKVLTYSD